VSKRLRCRHLAGLAQVKNPNSPAMVRARVTDDLMLEGGRRHRHADRDRAEDAEYEAAKRTARIKPTTPAGAGSLIEYFCSDDIGQADWHEVALKTAAAALMTMSSG
jgi:hypothetical protein